MDRNWWQNSRVKRHLRGNFYVEYKTEYFYRPTDKALFGDEPVVTPNWSNRLGRWFLTPSSQFSKEVYTPYLTNYLGEQAMISTLEQITAPIFKMSRVFRHQREPCTH